MVIPEPVVVTYNCRACGSANLVEILNLGNLAISDFLPDPEPNPERAPLELIRCADCTLVQLRHTVSRDRLYRTYHYKSGINESMVIALREVVTDVFRNVKLEPKDLWVDIGANDGTLLREVALTQPTVELLGFEPAIALAKEAESRAHCQIIPEFFPCPSSKTSDQPKVITSIAMFYDVDDPRAFVQAIKQWLHPDGVWVVQFQDLHAMLACNGFDNICHEHLTYWSLRPLGVLLGECGLRIVDAVYNATNGGSVRAVIKHGPVRGADPDRHLWSQDPVFRLQGFVRAVECQKEALRHVLDNFQRNGRTVWGYGASTKGNTLMQYCAVTNRDLVAIADRNPDKWGQYTAATNIPICSEEAMRQAQPDYLLVLPWHFVSYFVEREHGLLERGTRFIVPLPSIRMVSYADLQPILPETTTRARVYERHASIHDNG